MTINKDSIIGNLNPRRMDVRLDVLFEQEQVVIDNHRTKKDGMMAAEEADDEYNEGKDNAKTFIAKLYKETDDLHDIHRAVMKIVSCIEEKIKQKEFILSILEDEQQRREKNRWKSDEGFTLV